MLYLMFHCYLATDRLLNVFYTKIFVFYQNYNETWWVLQNHQVLSNSDEKQKSFIYNTFNRWSVCWGQVNQALVSSKFSNKLNQNIFNAFHQGPQTSQTTKILKIHKYSCGYYDNNTWFLHLLRRIMSYLMTIGCEMNQILLKTLKNHLKRYILRDKMYYYRSNHCK